MSTKVRKYKSEYARYQAADLQKKKRAARNKARRMMVKAGAVRPGDKKDVAHRNGNPLDNRRSNLTVQSQTKNRSYPRNRKAGKRFHGS
jgi:hypothetical protein|tara:strand:+ start:196 stop:462 length:267 start_codon:yes stop_codon:yes gene_type:complete